MREFPFEKTPERSSRRVFAYASVLAERQRLRFSLLLAVSFLGSLAESLGLAMFLPLMSRSPGNPEPARVGKLELLVSGFFSFCSIPVSPLSVLLTVFLFFSLKGLLKYFEGNLRGRLQAFRLYQMRSRLIGHYRRIEFSRFAAASKGSLAGLFTTEMIQVQSAFFQFTAFLISCASFAAFSFFALATNFSMTIFGIGLGGAAGLALKTISKKSNQNSKEASKGAFI